jgi:hypothetical protein
MGAATALALVVSQQANAQIIPRAEVQIGASQFSAAGDSDTSLGYGAAAGIDFDAGGFIIGVEGTYWWPGSCFKAKEDCPAEVRTVDQGNFVNHKTFEELGIAVRAGVMATPATLVYGKVGAVRNAQRKEILPGTVERRGPAPGYIYDSYKRGGWTAGVGVEHQLAGGPLYVKAEGRYSDYKRGQISGGTHMITGLLGLGVKFMPAAAAVILPPPPPPPPPPPATQTCPDGSVILATDVCPAPPPPPPPPPPAGERG